MGDFAELVKNTYNCKLKQNVLVGYLVSVSGNIMTVKIHIWNSNIPESSTKSALAGQDVGHASIEIGIENKIKIRDFFTFTGFQKIITIINKIWESPYPNYLYISHRPDQNYRSIKTLKQHGFRFFSLDFDFTKKFILKHRVRAAASITFKDDCANRGYNPDKTIEISDLDEKTMIKIYIVNYYKKLEYHALEFNCCTMIVNVLQYGLNCSNKNTCLFKRHLNNNRAIKVIPMYWTPKLISQLATFIGNGNTCGSVCTQGKRTLKWHNKY